ncbi:uncharacterized protein LOC135479555 isoform X2 [Liolophura sinensis]|uniref:uncharacterized protein LOC135479555 isoform X2 n=1 Tax=Liolophura sinensis TaxID=3198878 RepID=UPI00315910EA
MDQNMSTVHYEALDSRSPGEETSSDTSPGNMTDSYDGSVDLVKRSPPQGDLLGANEDMVPSVQTSPISTIYGYDNHSLEHELQHASDMSYSRSVSSTVRVEIADIGGEDSINLTTNALRRCKRQILRPYWKLLTFIGWRGFGKESINAGSCGRQVLNTVYPVCIVVVLMYTYIYEIVACQWKLDVKRDTQVIPAEIVTTPSTTLAPNSSSNVTTPIAPFTFFPAFTVPQNVTPSTDGEAACEHIITTYGIPNALHLLAFILGFYYFRIQENEQLYAIMEKVFLQATPLQGRVASQKKVIRKLRFFLICGLFWIVLTLGLQGLYIWAFNFPQLTFFKKIGEKYRWVFFGIEMLGILVLNSVNLAVVINYVTQCEMIIFYVKGMTTRLQEKSIDLRNAMKEIFRLRQNLSQLNGPIARMTSLVTVIFAELTVIGISILILNENDSYKVWVFRGIFPVVWMLILFFPLIQAARTNSICRRFKKLALEARVFGYKNNSQLDLDSFVLFVSNNSLRAKLFHIPILPSYLISVVVITCFIILLLFQTSVIGPANYFF